MAYLDEQRLLELWGRIDDCFARIGEAGGSIGLSGTTLTLYSAAGGALSSVDLGSAFPTSQEVTNQITSAVSGATSGLISASTANGRFGNSLTISGNVLYLINYNGTAIASVTLPTS